MRPEVPSQTALRCITPRPILRSVRFPGNPSLPRREQPVKRVCDAAVHLHSPRNGLPGSRPSAFRAGLAAGCPKAKVRLPA